MDRIKALIFKIAYPILQGYWFIFRPNTYGVKCVITDGDKLLFIKNTYGTGWTFPGGSIDKDETPEQAVRREINEELGISASNLKEIERFLTRGEFKRDHIVIFSTETSVSDIKIQRSEIEKYQWATLENSPKPMGGLAHQILSIYKGEAVPQDLIWK